MYIPSSFFSSQGACISASVTTTSGTGSVTSGSFVSASITWSYIQIFNGSDETGPNPVNYNANFTIHSGSTSQAKLLLVGAGGAGGQGQQTICVYSGELTAAGGGGGGGVVYYDNFPLAPGTYQVSVGVGGGGCGTPGRNGGNTTFNYSTRWSPFPTSLITATGGGYGGWLQQFKCSGPLGTTILYQGNSGGSAGGNVNSSGTGLGVQTQPCCNGLGGLNGANQGFAGGYGYNFANTTNASGGGGAGGAGQAVDQNFQSSPGYGGNGLTFNINGTSLSYAAGGGAVRAQGFPVINQSSANGVGTAGWGNGGHAESVYYGGGSPGASGTIIIAWPVCKYPPPPPPPAPPLTSSFSGIGLYRTTYNGYFYDNPMFYVTSSVISASADLSPLTASFATATTVATAQWLGYFTPRTSETYSFSLTTDDGSYLWIGNAATASTVTTATALINNGGLHTAQGVTGSIGLVSGTDYPIRIQYGNGLSVGVFTASLSTPTIPSTRNWSGSIYYNTASNGF